MVLRDDIPEALIPPSGGSPVPLDAALRHRTGEALRPAACAAWEVSRPGGSEGGERLSYGLLHRHAKRSHNSDVYISLKASFSLVHVLITLILCNRDLLEYT